MDRGQVHTLEAFVGALLIVGALLFATQATAVTPLSASTSNQHVENQQAAVGTDVLRLTAEDGSLQDALLYWNTSTDAFEDSPVNRTAYTGTPPDGHPLNSPLTTAFGTGERAYNIELRYLKAGNGTASQDLFEMGTPSDHAVTSVRMITLYENDNLTASGFESQQLVDVSDSYWAPNVNSSSSLYNVVEVRITVWRM